MLLQLLQEGGATSLAGIVASLAAMLWALLMGVLLILGVRVSPALAVGPLALPTVSALIGGQLALAAGAAAGASVAPAQRAALIAASIAESFAGRLVVGPATVLPAFVLLLLAAIAGARAAPRRYGFAAAGLAATGLLSILPLIPMVFSHTPFPVALGQSGIAGGLGLLTAVALLAGGGPDRTGPEAAITAALTLTLGIAATAASASAWGSIRVFAALSMVDPADRARLWASALAETAPDRACAWAAVGIATLLAGLAMMTLRATSSRRKAGAFMGVSAIPLAVSLLALDPAKSIVALFAR